MDFRLCMLLQGLSLLLLLVHTSCSCTKTSRDGPTSSPRHQHHHHVLHHQQHHRPSRQLQRQSRGLSEFLVPPPAPANFRGPRGPSSLPPPKNNNHNQPPPPPLTPPPLSPPPPPQHTRNGRYVNQQGGNGGNNNNGSGYFSKLMDWLNPFTGGGNGNNNDAIGKDSVGLGGSNYPKLQPPPPQPPVVQYAPQQPYTGGTGQYEPPPHPDNLQNGYSNLAPWMNGKPCNPCNQIPWIPVLGASSQHNSDPGQYAANVGGGRYLPPPPPQEVKTPDFSHSVPSSNQQNYPIPNPHLYPGVMPPLFKAEPFNVAPAGYQPPNLDQPHSPNFEQVPPGLDHQPLQNFDHPPPPNFNQQPPSHFDQSSPSNYDHPPPNFNQQPSSHFDKSPPNLDHPPQSKYNQPPPIINHPPQSNYNQAPNNLNHPAQQNFDLPSPPNFDHPPPPNFNHNQSPQNFDHPPDLNFDYASSNSNHPPSNFDQQPSEIIEDHPPPNFDHQSQNYDYNGGSDYGNQHSSNDDDQHPPSNFEQHHQPSQIVDVVKEAPTDLDHSDISDHHHQEPVHAESRPVYVNSAKSSSSPNDIDQQQHHRHRPTAPSTPNYQESHKGPIVHFQRSPLIDLSNIGESPSTTTTAITTTTPSSSSSSSSGSNRFLDSRPTDHIPVTIVPSKGKHSGESATLPSATLIDYIVSGADAESFSSSEEEKETRPPPRLQNERNALVLPSATTTTTTTTTSSTTTQRVMTRPVDQRRQESLIETLVQSYEFFKKRNNETLTNEARAGGRFYNETEDSSASREVVVPSKSENGKKIIQIIIPYTSQYTPSPFHSTKSDKDHHNHIDSSAAASNHPGDSEDSESHDDNVEDNVVIQESRRVSVTRTAPKDDLERLRNGNKTVSAPGNSIDVHRLQKNIDNWTIQVTPTTSMNAPDSVTIIEAIYPKNPKKPALPPKRNSLNTSKNSTSSEKVYVVTPVPNPNSLEDLDEASSKDSSSKSSKSRKPKNKEPVERAYQVLPQAVNNLAMLANAPESAAPALWGIMEHEAFAQSADQPRWRSDADELPEPASTPILYSGHSKVSRARSWMIGHKHCYVQQ
ncbi:eukaryotic translation initiation factor 4 gamma isoform X2 [Nasonia vitripennis]|uniref:Uncharacterized protein n=1 Tax=Nasonia vitripennis TaxID=7425 RepID=A0A7M7ITS6_NASVI|nr:eukaryotic translation initiation factor 4 gamma isoform X2 [Nasonia vitripennis]